MTPRQSRVVDFLAQKSAALMGPEPCVQPSFGQQRIVIALLDDAALVQYN
jgi:hypothetical protein